MRIRRIIPLAVAALLAAACAAPMIADAAKAAVPRPSVTIDSAGEDMAADGTLKVRVTVVAPRASARMSVRLMLYAPSGDLAYQTTRTTGNLQPGAQQFSFTHDLSGRSLDEGRYRLVVRATLAGLAAVSAEAPVYVVDSARPPLPLAVIVRFPAAPMADPSGAFATDPAAEPSARSEAEAFASLAAVRPDLRLSLVLPPMMLDEWQRVAGGYRLADPAAPQVPPGDATPSAYRRTLDALRLAADAGTPLMGVGYSDPSLEGLERMAALDDLGRQLDLGSSVTSQALGPRSTIGFVVGGGSIPASAAVLLAARGAGFVLLDPAGAHVVRDGTDATAAPGAHPIAETTLTALVVDTRLSDTLAGRASARPAVLDELFGRLTAEGRDGQPVVAVIEVGPGASATVGELQATLAALARMSWLRLVTAKEAASAPRGETVVLPRRVAGSDTPAATESHWAVVRTARDRALALLSAAGTSDADAQGAVLDIMVAESSAWAAGSTGQDLERGAAFASAADAKAWSTLSKVTLAVPNVTLAGSTGRVPVAVSNASDRPLQLVLRARPDRVRLRRGRTTQFLALPGETILSVPVDMGATISGGVQFEIAAGSLVLASGTSTVRASYMDRFFVVGTVVLVLLGLLWYIRRRGRGTMDRIRRAARGTSEPQR